jgi:hypothetical protein
MKILSNAIFTISVIIFFTALTLSFTIIQIIIHKQLIIDQNNVDIFDLLLKASFTLIGSSLSGFVAFLIFFLGDRKKEKEKVETETKILSKLKDEESNNIKIFKQMLGIFSDTTIEQLAKLLHMDHSKIKEALLIYHTKLDFSIFEASLKEISEKNYVENIDVWRKQKTIYDYLNLLLTNIKHEENSITLLNLIKSEIILLTKED